MKSRNRLWAVRAGLPAAAMAAVVLAATAFGQSGGPQRMMTKLFSGKKVNGGFVTHEHKDGKHVLTLSEDFQVPPPSPPPTDPHWQVVDSQGNAYLLNRLKVSALVGDKLSRTITVPTYVPDVAKPGLFRRSDCFTTSLGVKLCLDKQLTRTKEVAYGPTSC